MSTVVSRVIHANPESKTNNVHRGSRRNRSVRTRSLVPLLQSSPSTTATPTRTALGTPSAPRVTIAAARWSRNHSISRSDSPTIGVYVALVRRFVP